MSKILMVTTLDGDCGALFFEQENKTKVEMEIEDTTIKIEILDFNDIDKKFVDFIHSNFCGSDIFENKNFYLVE